jgi:CBS domain-containing protein
MMTLSSLLHALEPLSTTDTVGDALLRLAASHVGTLPVVSPDGTLEAIASETLLRQQADPATPLGTLLAGAPMSAELDTHVFDAAHLMRKHGLGTLPVLGPDGGYVGLVVRQDVFAQLAHMLATEEPGAIVVLDEDRNDFSLGRVAQIVEQNGARILSVSTEDDPGVGRIRVTLKLNVTDTARVRHLMAHYNHRVVAVFDEAEDDLEERAAEFLRYLEV